ncbi:MULTISPECIES: ABC transporter ATP-binding protein [Sinorhizobium]|uniref:ABC transporter ATP-binding protein n=1 Tax=Sinorhizobium TaxID=28105 RepID=UPI000BE802E9|nr:MULTISPECIES: ABC transporter ATP-binding protein [Sinorhizobium]PDT50928.1 ABC transporter ATP-binding protein [Sinorhizobium sp. NG07B]POH25045.1 ABC transporter ATP-binding protein [Sinorhizobium americanum]
MLQVASDKTLDNNTVTKNPALDCRNLSAFYGRIQVVFDVSLAISPGECLALLGPNGAGKTSLLGAIGGTVRSTGRAAVKGAKVSELSAHRRAKSGLSYVPEVRRNLFHTMSVRENLDVGLSLSPPAERHRIVDFSLQLFPILKQRMATAAGMLSGGEQQMLAIAVALGREPSVLLLDEPSQGLAPAVFDILQGAFAQLRTRGIAVLLAEQNLPFASLVSDRYVVLSHGHVVAAGGQEEMKDHRNIFKAYLGSEKG